jgi:hypothetical protein
MGISLHRCPIGETGVEVRLPGILYNGKRGLWKRSISLYGGCARGTWGEGSFQEGTLLYWGLGEKVRFSFIRRFFIGKFKRCVKKCCVN